MVRQSSSVTLDELSRSALTESGRLRIDVFPASDLNGQAASDWETMRSLCPDLASPFFSSTFSRVVGQLRPFAKIAAIHRDDVLAGFLPLEFVGRNIIEPIGKAFNDSHGLICDPAAPLGYCDVLNALGVKMFRFHSLAGPGHGYQSHVMGTGPSFLANLAAHPEGYVAYLENSRGTISKQRRKSRKMVQDLGPLRLELDCRDESALESTISLKRDQYQRSYIFDILSVDWSRQMLRQLWQQQDESCRGLLSVLYAGDKIVAAHFGMIEGELLHYWFPVFDRQHRQYSPGTALFLRVANQAASLGIKRIDLGYGDQGYKHKLVDTITEVPYGCVSLCRTSQFREHAMAYAAAQLKRMPAKNTIKRMVRSVWPSLGIRAYD